MIVIDSTLIIDYLCGKADAKSLYGKISKEDLIYTTIFNYQEATFLPIQNNKDKDLAEVNAFFEKIKILYPTKNSVLATNRISSYLKKIGKTVEIIDCLIAGITIKNNAKLLTLNKKHFQDMPNIVLYED